MRLPLDFDEYLKRGVVKKQTPDKSRTQDLIRESERKFNSLNKVLDKIGLSDENANDVVEYCYDIIMNLIRAKMFVTGFNSSGKGAHEAEVAYLRKLDFSEVEINFVNQLRYFRNGIMYYGKLFDGEYATKAIKFMGNVRERLR